MSARALLSILWPCPPLRKKSRWRRIRAGARTMGLLPLSILRQVQVSPSHPEAVCRVVDWGSTTKSNAGVSYRPHAPSVQPPQYAPSSSAVTDRTIAPTACFASLPRVTATPIQLWQTGTKRCVITPARADPPYTVFVFDGQTLASSIEFRTHDEAVTDAIAKPREASPPTNR
jgi:hypothetical protein